MLSLLLTIGCSSPVWAEFDLPLAGWTCSASKHWPDITSCQAPEHPGFTWSLRATAERDPHANGPRDAKALCKHSVGTCRRERMITGDLYGDLLTLVHNGVTYTALISGPRIPDPSITWRAADEWLPQVRFHALEEACLAKTGKPCVLTLGEMVLQPDGDPRAVAK